MASTNLCLDLTDHTLLLNVADFADNDSVSSLGSTSSFEDDESVADSVELPEHYCQPREHRSRPKTSLSDNMVHRKPRRNVTAPDMKQHQSAKSRNKAILPEEATMPNARWVSEATRSFSNMSFTRPGYQTNKRKTRSLDEKGYASNHEWTASRTKKPASKIANEILGKSAHSPSPMSNCNNRWSTSLQASSDLSPAHLLRSTPPDHSPKTQNTRRCDRNKPRSSANDQWTSGPKVAVRLSSSVDAPPRHPSAGNRARYNKWDCPLNQFGNRSSLIESQHDRSPNIRAISRWHSSADSLDVFREPTRYVPVRALSRWDSSASFTVASVTSMDQLSTKLKRPKRRPRRRDSIKTKGEPSHQVDDHKIQIESHSEETQGSPVSLRTMKVETARTTATVSNEEATATLMTTKREVREENTPEASIEGGLKIDDRAYCEENSGGGGYSSDVQTHLRCAMTTCKTLCFDTIPEEVVTEENGIPVLPALQRRQFCDSMLGAPKRRNSLLALNDDSDASSLIGSSVLDTSSSCHKRRAEHDLSRCGPRLPKRRGSGGCPLSGVDSSFSGLDDCRNCVYRRSSGHHQASCHPQSPHESPQHLGRRSSTGDDEKHPVNDMYRAISALSAITANRTSGTMKPITATKAPSLLRNDLLPIPKAVCDGKCPAA
jgi:hypothetical protein